jgi:hypothetical protein
MWRYNCLLCNWGRCPSESLDRQGGEPHRPRCRLDQTTKDDTKPSSWGPDIHVAALRR